MNTNEADAGTQRPDEFSRHHLRLVTITPDDVHRVQQLVEACSPESQYSRFLMGVGRVSTRFAADLCDFDADTRRGYGLEAADKRLVAHASLLPDISDPGGRAGEVALLVRDDYQGRGLGGGLLRHLVRVAASLGLTELRADVLSGNRRVIGLIRRNGGQLAWADGSLRQFVIPVPSDPSSVDRGVDVGPPRVRS